VTEKQLAEKIKNLLQEKTEILEKMSEYNQKVLFWVLILCFLIFCYWLHTVSATANIFLFSILTEYYTDNLLSSVWLFLCLDKGSKGICESGPRRKRHSLRWNCRA